MKGDVQILIDCSMPELLLDRATGLGIVLLKVSRVEAHAIIVEVDAVNEKRLLELCSRFSISASVLERRGRSAFAGLLRRRWTIIPGLLVAVVLTSIFLGRIWRVDIRFTGDAAELGNAAAFEPMLYELGVRAGISRNIDTEQLSDELLARAEGYGFIGTRIEGVRLLIEAAPELPAPEVYHTDEVRDLFAAYTGVVVSVDVEAGNACVSPGDTVVRGQCVIRGEEKASSESTRGVRALGRVIVRTWFQGSAEASLYEANIRPTGRQSVSAALYTPWAELPIMQGETFGRETVDTEIIPIGGLYLPVCIMREIRREVVGVAERRDRTALAASLERLSTADARAMLAAEGPNDYEIIRSWTNYTQPSNNVLHASTIYEITANTAEAREDIPEGG